MDARERLGEHRLDPEVHGASAACSRGALPVVVARDDDPLPHSFRRLRNSGSRWRRVNSAMAGTFERGHHLDAVRGEVPGRDVVGLDGGDARLERIAERRVLRRALDVRPAWDLDLLGLLVGRREEWTSSAYGPELGHRQQLGRLAVLARVGDLAGQERPAARPGSTGRPSPPGSRALREVPVEGAQRIGVRRRRLPMPTHGRTPARASEPPRPKAGGTPDSAIAARICRDPGSRGRDRRMHDLSVLSARIGAGQREVVVARIDRGADAYLGDLGAGDSSTGTTLSGCAAWPPAARARPGRSRPGRRSRRRPRGRGRRSPPRGPGAQPVLGVVVGREHRGGGAELGDHVGDRGALGDAQVGRPGTGELEHLVLAAAGGRRRRSSRMMSLAWTQGRQFPLEPHLDHLGTSDLVRVPPQHDRHVEPAGADRDHPRQPA